LGRCRGSPDRNFSDSRTIIAFLKNIGNTHATLLGEVGESLRSAQAILGPSDLKTTLNVYTHAIPESQRRAVDKVAEVRFADVRNAAAAAERQKVN